MCVHVCVCVCVVRRIAHRSLVPQGADIVYYEAAANRLVDAHVKTQLAKPVADKCQDWTLVAAEQSNGKLVVEVSRKLIVTDPQDRSIANDESTPLPTPVLAAWGDSAEISYHTTAKRVGATVRFYGAQANGVFDPLAGLKAAAGVKTADVNVPNFPVPTMSTFGGRWPQGSGTGMILPHGMPLEALLYCSKAQLCWPFSASQSCGP